MFRNRSQNNAKKQFDALLAPHIELMYRMSYQWLQNQDDAEDLVQETLTGLVTKVDEMLAIEQLRPWLIKVLYRRFVDHYRRQQRSPFVDPPSESDDEDSSNLSFIDQLSVPDESHRLALQQQLSMALMTLDEDQRAVVSLHFVEGYTASEVAEILGVQEGTVKSRIDRAKKKLKNFYKAGPF